MVVIELNGSENITTIRHLLEQAAPPLYPVSPQARRAVGAASFTSDVASSEVLLYVPKGSEALENNCVNLALLRRWADNLALHLALVIEHRETRKLAREVGLLVVHSVKQAQSSSLRYLDRRRRRHEGLPPRPISSILRSRPTRPSGVRTAGSSRRVLAALVVSLALLTALLASVFVLVPSATISLDPKRELVEASLEMTAVAGLSDVSYETGEIPARTVSVEREGVDSIATTGRTEVPDGYAEGVVVFANKTTTGVTIPKGTVVRTSSGDNVRFFTVSDAWLPGDLYGSVRVGILAAEPGPRGNVSPLRINTVEGGLAAQTEVLNDARTTGGSVRGMGVVDAEDAVVLRARLMKRLQEEAYREITAGLAQTDFVAPDSLGISVLDEQFDHKVGNMVDQLGLTMRVKVTGLAVDTAHGRALLLSLLEQRTRAGYGLLTDSAIFGAAEQLAASPETARFKMGVRASVAPLIDPQEVSRSVAGKTVADAEQLLLGQFSLTAAPNIELLNSPLRRLPWWSRRIRVLVSDR